MNATEAAGNAAGRHVDAIPLVSIVLFVRNRVATVRNAIESVLGQDYPNVELVVQDGASTDGTLEVLRSYGSRIDLLSEPDAGVHDGFWRALQRVKGQIIGTCLSDEQLTPGAISRAVSELRAAPETGAITGDAYFSDYSGNIFQTWTGQDFDFLAYLVGDYCPHFSASFFRRSALEEAGLFESVWREGRKEPVEFEIWCRLGTQRGVKYVPHFFYKFGTDPGQLSHDMPRIVEELDRRVVLMDAYLFGKDNFFGENREMREFIIQRQHEILVNHLRWNNKPDGALAIELRMYAVLGRKVPVEMRFVPGAIRCRDWRFLGRFATEAVRRALRKVIPVQRLAVFVRRARNYVLRRLLRDSLLRRAARWVYYRIRAVPVADFAASIDGDPTPPPSDQRGRFYVYTAGCFRSRGLVAQALQMYRKAEAVNDAVIDASACQLALASPDFSDADLEPLLRRWSAKHIGPAPHMAPRIHGQFAGVRARSPLTIGYHCVFWTDPCADALALPFIAAHDREAFRIVGYSPWTEPMRIQAGFDRFHGNTERYNDEDFAALVRSDGVDVFVELSGLSHYHRFGAMALRCAPIQVNYINHLATTQVANVDYVLGDAIAFPKGSDLYYSEAIYRLERCFLCYDYTSMSMPELAEPPFVKNGFITFGSFGGPYKLNAECLELWAMVLRSVPDSLLLIQNAGMSKRSNVDFIHRQFRRHGIEERLITLPGTDRWTNLQNYARMDVCLDTWPYCGGNSTAEALWSGVPVVTLKGPRAVAAYGASLLTAAGLSDLVASSPAEYVDLARRLASDRLRLRELRKHLRRMTREHGLADPVRMARALETAFLDMTRLKFGRFADPVHAATQPGVTAADFAE